MPPSRPLPRAVLAVLLVALLPACGPGEAERPETGGAAAATEPTQPLDADIWVAELTPGEGGLPSLGAPREAIRRPGYDNQPHFTPDGRGFWFAALDEHTSQTDIWRWNLDGSLEQVVLSAPESEYSPTPLPDGTGLSVVRVEADSTQRLWRIPLDGSTEEPILPNLEGIGYHAWAADDRVVVFVLDTPPTLRVADPAAGPAEVVAEGIGRSIQRIPGTEAVSFVRLEEGRPPLLMRYDAATGTLEPIVETLGGGEFHAWTPDGTLLMAEGAALYAWRPDEAATWTEIGRLDRWRIRITRLAVSPDGRHIALVVEPADLPL